MSEVPNNTPFKPLGGKLKAIRQKLQESVAEVSGAVEIDSIVLERIEKGVERPAEDLLMLLISHFGVHDDAAVQLWELAGYDQPSPGKDNFNNDEQQNRSVMIMMTLDTRILYTDSAHISASKSGVVLNFMQNAQGSQQTPISRVGMSYDQANDLLAALKQTIDQASTNPQIRLLPAPKKPPLDKTRDAS